jgi:DNA-binding IclR family transcriptional regulator
MTQQARTASMSETTKYPERGGSVQSVKRAATILRMFGQHSPELGVSEVGRRLHLHKSTASRLLATLESEGFVERVPDSEKYRLGLEFMRLAGQTPRFTDVRSVALPFLRELAERSGETVNLAVLDDDMVVNIEQVSGPYLVAGTNWIGRRTPLHCVANGKILLACRSRPDIDRALAVPLTRFTARTVTGKTALRAELARARTLGYAVALGEIEEGLHAVAAPVRDAQGTAIAAVSVSGPSYRMLPEQMAVFARMTVEVAERISAVLGATARRRP